MTVIAIIGAGYWGSNHIRNYMEFIESKIISKLYICDENKAALTNYENLDNVYTTNNPDDIINNTEISLVDISTPTPSHFPLAKKALERNKHVFVEKPISFKHEEAIELYNLASSKNLTLMTGHIFRFHEALLQLKAMIQKNYFGSIIHIDTTRSAYAVPRPDMGVLHALGVHDVDIACMLLNEETPESILCWGKGHYRDYDDEIASLLLKFKNNITFSANESWLNPTKQKVRELVLTGTKASARIDYLVPDTIIVYGSYIKKDSSSNRMSVVEGGERTIRIPYKEPLKEELLNFIESSTKGVKNGASGLIGARAVYLIEKAFESLRSKAEIKIDKMNEFSSIT